MGTQAPHVANVEETRIALAFSGGVALAIYESGVAVEFFRLAMGDGIYGELKSLIGPVTIDVLTGTSAGGLNSTFLANALVNQGDLNQLLNVWRDEADIERLLYPVFKRNPASLLDGDFFYRKIFEALMARRCSSGTPNEAQSALDLFITATNLDGDRVDVETHQGERIATRTHRQVFHFRYRRRTSDQEQEINDFKTHEDMARLALAARTTASFPVAFEPVLIKKSQMGKHATRLETDAYHIDGGVLDNRPIALALKAIATRTADKRVHRRLFYIEPNPEQILPRVGQLQTRDYNALEVALKAVVGLPSYQSITSALEDLVQHNRDVAVKNRTLTYYENITAFYQSVVLGDPHPPGAHDHCHAWFVDITDPHTAPVTTLYRAVESSYLDLRLRQDVSPTLSEMVDALMNVLREDLEEEDKARIQQAPAAAAPDQANGPKSIREYLFRLKRNVLDHFDLAYYRRLYGYMVVVALGLYPDKPKGTGDGGGVEWDYYLKLTDRLNRLKEFFYQQVEAIARLERAEDKAREAELVRVESLVRRALLTVQQRTAMKTARSKLQRELEGAQGVGDGDEGGPAGPARNQIRRLQEQEEAIGRHTAEAGPRYEILFSRLLEKLQDSEFYKRRCDVLDRLLHTAQQRLENEATELRGQYPPPAEGLGESDWTQEQVLSQKIRRGYVALHHALYHYFMRDMLIYPTMQDGDVGAELALIRFARISPSDASLHLPGLSSREKLAGKALAHFGGFLSNTWRGNDLTWGRLDAAEIILTQLLPPDLPESRVREWVAKVQKDILEDMGKRGMRIYHPPKETEFEYLIGKQTLSNIPLSDRIRWSLRGVLTTMKILRRSVAESGATRWVRGVVNVVDYGVNVFTWIVALVSFALAHLWSSKTLRVVAVVVVIGLMLLPLWERSLRDWWYDVLWPVLGRRPAP